MRAQLVAQWHEEILENIDVEMLLDETEDMSFADVEGIKTHMVTAKVVRGIGWDLEQAIDEFSERQVESATFKFHGFDPAATKPKRKKKKRSLAEAQQDLFTKADDKKSHLQYDPE
jgi:hypothetical protein